MKLINDKDNNVIDFAKAREITSLHPVGCEGVADNPNQSRGKPMTDDIGKSLREDFILTIERLRDAIASLPPPPPMPMFVNHDRQAFYRGDQVMHFGGTVYGTPAASSRLPTELLMVPQFSQYPRYREIYFMGRRRTGGRWRVGQERFRSLSKARRASRRKGMPVRRWRRCRCRYMEPHDDRQDVISEMIRTLFGPPIDLGFGL